MSVTKKSNTCAFLYLYRIVKIDHDLSISCAAIVVQFTLPFDDAFHATKSFHMGFAIIGDVTYGGFRYGGKKGNFSLMIRSHLYDCNFTFLWNSEQGEGYTDMIVKVASCCMRCITLL
ncbi:MAG: Uncharacterised protein [Cryomorphaceae bacterium]|nr:MAG: Uncharacterised protein [Cryomorphaceae bacterium]